MYIPKQFDEPCVETMHDLIKTYPLATLVNLSSTGGINANHIPLYLDVADDQSFGRLQGHIARANPLWHDFHKQTEVLAVFQAANAYISPSWYASKQTSAGKVVPTWNYAAVHAYGTLSIIDDANWLYQQLQALTSAQESKFSEPWMLNDAPDDFIEALTAQIIGIEISITQLSGKWKVSQNQTPENQESVIKGLNEHSNPDMAALVKKFGNRSAI